jgi:eukaryotic-like serine/threonine-protein kinase
VSSEQRPFLPEEWSDLAPLLDQLLDTPTSERPALLDTLTAGNPVRRSQLEQLLAECERERPLLEAGAAGAFPGLLLDDDGPALPEVLGERYRIESELGSGGMARVYLAQDLKHDRRVAVKVIRHEIASSLGHDRFLREIGIAARLRHPNIMPLYDSGEVRGLLYFTMPFEPGKSLRARLDTGPPLGITEAISILRDVARALACAHDQGVVHRDIKPDNVLLSGDAAVVTDFGIAKALSVSAIETGGTTTHTGTVVGTPAYMSPEQATGDPSADHRTDIYAFGCLGYELLAGSPPFVGSPHRVISAHIAELPRPLAELRPDVPESIAALIDRCLRKNPEDRPASASELLEALGAATTSRAPVAFPRRRQARRLTVIAVVLIVATLGAWQFRAAAAGGPVSIGVLPLEVTGDAAQDLAEGFTEDLATSLVRTPWLAVPSRSGARNYSGRDAVDARVVCDTLRVRYLLMGSLRESAEGRRVTLRLVQCEPDRVRWAETFTAPFHLEDIRNRIVRAVSDTLRPDAGRFALQFAVDTSQRQLATNDDAYVIYLRGKKRLSDRGLGVLASIDLFREAIALDSTAARAWSGLSLALGLSVVTQLHSLDSVRAELVASARHAMRLDPGLAESHVALGVYHGLELQWEQAERELGRAIALDPLHIESRAQYTRILLVQGRFADAHRQMNAALQADPASSQIFSFKGHVFTLERRLDSARVWSNRAFQTNPDAHITRIFRGMLLAREGRAIEAARQVRSLPRYEAYALYLLAAAGDSATVRAQLATLSGSQLGSAAPETARAYALLGLGDTVGGLDALERGLANREVWPNISYTALPVFDAVRGSQRFQELRRRARLPPL